MNIATITNQTSITSNNVPTNLFLTNYNNMVTMINVFQSMLSQSFDITYSISSGVLTINAHTRVYPDGSVKTMPAGTVSVVDGDYVYFNGNSYIASTKRYNGLLVGYYGTDFTPYKVSNI